MAIFRHEMVLTMKIVHSYYDRRSSLIYFSFEVLLILDSFQSFTLKFISTKILHYITAEPFTAKKSAKNHLS